MSYRQEKTQAGNTLVIDGWETGIAPSPYKGIANIRNLNTSYYPGVIYGNYARQSVTLAGSAFYAGIHSINVSNNVGWIFSTVPVMTNPVASAVSPAGLIYFLDNSGQIFKQLSVNSTEFDLLRSDPERLGNGSTGIAYWNNYLIVFGDGFIEFCGNGTNDSGVISSNWNLPGPVSSLSATTNLLTVSDYVFTAGPAMGATSAVLTTAWGGLSGTYSVTFSNAEVRSVVFTNASTAVSWTGGLTTGVTASFQMYQTAVSAYGAVYEPFLTGNIVTLTSSGSLPTGLSAGTQYYLLSDLVLAQKFRLSTTPDGPFIPLTDAGSGVITVTLVPPTVPPIANTTITGFTWDTGGIGSQTITLATPWLGANGIYNIVDPVGNNMLALFSYNSTTVALLNPATFEASTGGTFLVQILNPLATTNKTWISKVDGSLYFANGRWVGRIQVSPNPNATFNPGIPATYSVNYAATGVLQPQDTVVDLTDLRGQLVILGNKDAYPWDYVSAQPSASFPIGEQTYGMINILNTIYILAGQKGNIYVTNGYSAQLMYKIPDFIASIVDPVWSWGGLMFHRAKLYLQAVASSSAGTPILSGIFSLIVSPSLTGEVASGLVMEAQNSFGLAPANSIANGVLVDNTPSANGNDSYYSAWSNGTNIGGIDYNNTTLWNNFEPIIESDMIPIGPILEKATLGIIEFKLDRPMVAGDEIRIYFRTSLTDSYNLMGSTTTAVLSDYYNTGINAAQWLQFMVKFKYASSNSSFIPLREIRLHINQ